MKDRMNNIKQSILALAVCALVFPLGASAQTIRGDFNMDGQVTVSDVISMISCLLNDSPGELSPIDRDTVMVNDIPVVMVRVKGGVYSLSYGDVRTVDEFWIGETEVTYDLWWAVMGNEKYPYLPMCVGRPMTYVSWDECQVFLDSLSRLTGRNFRMPTSDEWVFAATGGTLTRGYDYSGSNDINEVAWYSDNTDHLAYAPIVATKAPNELGLYDMCGNVAEWCQEVRETVMPDTVYRNAWTHGGHYMGFAEDCRPTSVIQQDPGSRYGHPNGLRLAISAGE